MHDAVCKTAADTREFCDYDCVMQHESLTPQKVSKEPKVKGDGHDLIHSLEVSRSIKIAFFFCQFALLHQNQPQSRCTY